jgi:hypothetical protein
VVLLDPGVVTRDEDVALELRRSVEQGAEPHLPIALDTRIRRHTREVSGAERLDDRLGELLDVVEDVVRDVELGGDTPGILGVRQRAAPGHGHPTVRRLPLLEGDADDVEALVDHEGSGHGTVDTSRHRHERSHHSPFTTEATTSAASRP